MEDLLCEKMDGTPLVRPAEPPDTRNPKAVALSKSAPFRQYRGACGANAVITIIYNGPVLHFKFFRVTMDLSNGRRLHSSARPFRNPCKHYYYSGHRIRPRLRPLGSVFRGDQRGKES